MFARPLSAALVCMDHPAALVCACVVCVFAPRCHGVCSCSLTAISVCVCLLLAVCVCCLPTALVCACVVHVLYTGCVCSISISLSPPSAVSYDAKGIFPPVFRTKYLAFLPSNGALANRNNITKVPHYHPISHTLRILTILIVTKIVL